MNRIPIWARIALFLAVLIGALLPTGPGGAGIILALAALCLACTRRIRSLPVLFTAGAMALITGGYQSAIHGPARGFEVGADLLACVVIALAVAGATSIEQIARLAELAAAPMRMLGVSPERIGLLVSLALAGIPRLVETVTMTRHAALARGLERSPRAHTLPVVLRAVSDAHLLGDALLARGIGDEAETGPGSAAAGG